MKDTAKKTYTMEDNVKSIFFQNRDILKALEEIKRKLGLAENEKASDSDNPPW